MVIRHILLYLIEHPDAKDTIRGILQWWVPSNREKWGAEEVQEALDVLVARGWLIQRQIASFQLLYALNKARLEEIRTFLHRPDRTSEGQHE